MKTASLSPSHNAIYTLSGKNDLCIFAALKHNIMRKVLLLLALCCTITLTSCKKSGVNLFVGDYSFKSSGEIAITVEAEYEGENLPIPASLNVSLINDIGQLNISSVDKKTGEVIVVINYLSGDVVTTTGICDGNEIELDEYRRTILPISISTMFSSYYYIKVSGTGHIYDDNTIVFDMRYNGKGTIGSVTYKIKDKDVTMVAYRN